jgi:hypothetical protein
MLGQHEMEDVASVLAFVLMLAFFCGQLYGLIFKRRLLKLSLFTF